MIQATWMDDELELVQLEDGLPCTPTNDERRERWTQFRKRLTLAIEHFDKEQQPLPREPLPLRPIAAKGVDTTSTEAPSPGASSIARSSPEADQSADESLIEAVGFSRQAQEDSCHMQESNLANLEHRIVVHEDALTVHGVLVQLF